MLGGEAAAVLDDLQAPRDLGIVVCQQTGGVFAGGHAGIHRSQLRTHATPPLMDHAVLQRRQLIRPRHGGRAIPGARRAMPGAVLPRLVQ